MIKSDTVLTPENIAMLDDADLAAFAHRREWLKSAFSDTRGAGKGKQIPPDSGWQITLLRAGRGLGKGLTLNTRIPTPSGWTTMGEIAPGDEVFDEYGVPCRVTFVTETYIPKKAYRFTFSDNTVLEACDEHQWVTWTHADRKAFLRSPYEDTTRFPDNWSQWRLKRRLGGSGDPVVCADSPGPRIRTSEDINRTLVYGKRGDTNHCIPLAAPLALPEAILPLDPYVLGYWLGNGNNDTGELCAGSYDGNFDHTFIKSQVEAAGYETTEKLVFDRGSSIIRAKGLKKQLRGMWLLNDKHVPDIYLRASIPQRMALLRGLMDSDGYTASNYCEFCSTTAALADAVLELVRSLGCRPVLCEDRARLNGVDYGPRYRITWRPTFNPFLLPRKADLIVSTPSSQALRKCRRMIVSCELITPAPMRCISVDSPNAMYLAGDGMIPTHNTRALTEWLFWEMWRCPDLIGHAISPTLSDIRGTLFEGNAGFCSIIPAECLKGGSLEKAYNKSTHELRLVNGSLIRGFSATDDGSRLRGPQAMALIGDEIAQWDKPAGNLEQVMSNALFGLRLKYPDGTPSRAMFGTTPLPIPFLKRFEKREGVRLVTGSSYENMENLDDNFRVQLRAMAGTLLGRQEIDGAYIDEESDRSIIKRRWINLFPYYMPDGVTKRKLPMFSFIIEAYDTATSEHNVDKKRQTTDPSGSIVLGVFNVNQYFTEAERRRMNCKSKYAALLCDAWTEHLGLPELLEKARNQHRIKWGSDPARRPDITLIEDKSSGPSLRQFLVKYGVPCYAYNPGKENKTTRLHAISPLVNQGMLFVPESDISKRPDRKGLPRDWVEPFLEQVCAFSGPGSTEHDEFVDTFSSAMSYLRNRGILDATPDEPYIDRDEKIDADRGEARRIHNSTRPRITPNPYA